MLLAKRVLIYSDEYYEKHAAGWRPGAISHHIDAYRVDDETPEFGVWMTIEEDEVTGKDFQALLARARDRQDKILKTKGDDYTIDQAEADRLYNFKEIGELLDLDPKQVLMVYLFKHIFSIAAYVKAKKESEPIDGRIDDAINYLYLLLGLIDEGREEVPF